jgi:tetratricopeptide (TPR) repeat protein
MVGVDFDPTDARNLLYERSPEHWKIFVSSKMSGGALRKERSTAAMAINSFDLCRAWAWENDADAGPYCSERECVAQAGTSDGLVLILEDELTDVTRAEFTAARNAGAPVYIMLRTGANRDAALDEFISSVRDDDVITASFSSQIELRTRILSALRTWALRSGRSRMLRAREHSASRVGNDASATAFEDIEISTGDDGSRVRLTVFLAKAEETVAAGDPERALTELYVVAEGAAEAGLGWLAVELVDQIDRIVPADALDDRWRGWLCNVRGLGLSGGKSNPKARQQFERMRQLGRALNDPDLESTALQNLGVQDVIEGDHKAAGERFLRSLEMKKELGDWRGWLQVLLNFVNVLEGRGKLGEADQLLDSLEEILADVRDPHLRSSLYGQRGHLAVARGDLTAAQTHFQASLRCARRSGAAPRIITCIQNLGSVAHDLGDPARAAKWYAKALELAERIDDSEQRRIQRQSLAVANGRLGRYERAAELFLSAADDAEQLGDQLNAAVATGDAGASLMEAGDAKAARELTERALGMLAGTDDWRAHQLINLGAELEALDEPQQAVDRLLEAAELTSDPADRAAALRRGGELAIRHPATASRAPAIFEREIAIRRSHETPARWAWRAAEIGATLSHTSQAAGARTFFALGLRVFARRADRREAFFIRNDRAIVSAELGDFDGAVSDLRACVTIAERSKDRALAQQAHMNLGEIRRRQGDLQSATTHLNRSLTIARALQDREAQGQTHNLLASLAQDEGDVSGAYEHLNAAQEQAVALRDRRMQGEAYRGKASLENDAGRYRRAASLYRKAARLLAGEPSRQLAECLGAQLVSSARGGQLDEQALKPLPELSAQLGWDEELLSYAIYAADVLSERGTDEDMATLVSFTLAVAFRLGTSGEGDELLVPFMQVGATAARWADGSDSRRQLLDAALQDSFPGDAAAELWSLVERVVEAIEAS